MTKFTISFFGGKKGLLENSEDLCKTSRRVQVSFTEQNGRVSRQSPVVGTSCKGE